MRVVLIRDVYVDADDMVCVTVVRGVYGVDDSVGVCVVVGVVVFGCCYVVLVRVIALPMLLLCNVVICVADSIMVVGVAVVLAVDCVGCVFAVVCCCDRGVVVVRVVVIAWYRVLLLRLLMLLLLLCY